MPKWIVETRVTQRRTYYVTADNEKEAEAKTCGDVQAEWEEDENEETMSIVLDESTAA